jgi:hypothetical protein
VNLRRPFGSFRHSVVLRESPEAVRQFPSELGIARTTDLTHSIRPSSVVLRESPEAVREFPSELGIARTTDLTHSTRPSSVVLRKSPEAVREFPSELGIARTTRGEYCNHPRPERGTVGASLVLILGGTSQHQLK